MLLDSNERLAEQSFREVTRVPDWFCQQVHPGAK